ncbi:hypothetical protein MN608_00716 [Microdochium nivale]|nr:hypothetical protein MN608_00716 [Microdochium nivale]
MAPFASWFGRNGKTDDCVVDKKGKKKITNEDVKDEESFSYDTNEDNYMSGALTDSADLTLCATQPAFEVLLEQAIVESLKTYASENAAAQQGTVIGSNAGETVTDLTEPSAPEPPLASLNRAHKKKNKNEDEFGQPRIQASVFGNYVNAVTQLASDFKEVASIAYGGKLKEWAQANIARREEMHREKYGLYPESIPMLNSNETLFVTGPTVAGNGTINNTNHDGVVCGGPVGYHASNNNYWAEATESPEDDGNNWYSHTDGPDFDAMTDRVDKDELFFDTDDAGDTEPKPDKHGGASTSSAYVEGSEFWSIEHSRSLCTPFPGSFAEAGSANITAPKAAHTAPGANDTGASPSSIALGTRGSPRDHGITPAPRRALSLDISGTVYVTGNQNHADYELHSMPRQPQPVANVGQTRRVYEHHQMTLRSPRIQSRFNESRFDDNRNHSGPVDQYTYSQQNDGNFHGPAAPYSHRRHDSLSLPRLDNGVSRSNNSSGSNTFYSRRSQSDEAFARNIRPGHPRPRPRSTPPPVPPHCEGLYQHNNGSSVIAVSTSFGSIPIPHRSASHVQLPRAAVDGDELASLRGGAGAGNIHHRTTRSEILANRYRYPPSSKSGHDTGASGDLGVNHVKVPEARTTFWGGLAAWSAGVLDKIAHPRDVANKGRRVWARVKLGYNDLRGKIEYMLREDEPCGPYPYHWLARRSKPGKDFMWSQSRPPCHKKRRLYPRLRLMRVILEETEEDVLMQ